MKTNTDDIIRSWLKPGYRLDLAQTQTEYNELASMLYLGVGVIGAAAYVLLPHFDYIHIFEVFLAYCFVMPVILRLLKQSYPMWLSVLQVPAGLAIVVSLQWIMPLELVHITAFLYPLAFIFTFHFHSGRFFTIALAMTFGATGFIITHRQLPYYHLYFITTLGATLIIGFIVHSAVSKTLRLANYDALTGLVNRRHWETTVLQLIAISRRENLPLSIVFLDLDNFKAINDEKGHLAGDDVLRWVGQRMLQVSRESDCLGRWGGDEFAIALFNTDEDQANAMVRRLQNSLADIQISPGIVTLENGDTLESLLRRADHEMYSVKHSKQSG